jgi:RNA polymerase sigma factor for flagellar operon FliA
LVEHYAYLVHAAAARLARRLPTHVGLDEISSAGFEGLIQAVESFDPSQSTRFELFCQRRIVGAVMDWLRTADVQSRLVRVFERKRARAVEALRREWGRPPTSAETAARLDLPIDRYEELSRLSRLGCEVHFSAMEARDHDRSDRRAGVWDVRDERSADPRAGVSRELLAGYLTRGLSRSERLVLILYYYQSLTMTEIGAVLGLSESRVSQIHKEVLAWLRDRADARLAEELAA